MTFNNFFGLVMGLAAIVLGVWKFGFWLPIIVAMMIYSHKAVSSKK